VDYSNNLCLLRLFPDTVCRSVAVEEETHEALEAQAPEDAPALQVGASAPGLSEPWRMLESRGQECAHSGARTNGCRFRWIEALS
jgi:hypothetical protein